MKIIKYKKMWLSIGVAIIIISLALIFGLGLKAGIDFTGGALMEVSYDNRPDKSVIETRLNTLEFSGYSLRTAVDETGRDTFMLRTRDLSETERLQVESALTDDQIGSEVTRFTSVGPTIGSELQSKAKWAVGAVALIIVIYVAIAFLGVRWPVGSFAYGVITVIALIHDVLVPTAVMSLLGYFYGFEVNVLFVMALLAVLGYSVNDTIVIFDRVRENIVKYRKEHKRLVNAPGGIKHEEVTYSFDKPFSEVVDLSINETLLRSINTSLTTALALLALYFVGGEATRIFALVMLVGVGAGAYSSIFLASPLLVWYAEHKENKTNKQ